VLFRSSSVEARSFLVLVDEILSVLKFVNHLISRGACLTQ
jgi:hypothetical protein